jgi:hypothetical protein
MVASYVQYSIAHGTQFHADDKRKPECAYHITQPNIRPWNSLGGSHDTGGRMYDRRRCFVI